MSTIEVQEAADRQASLEAVLKDEVLRMYQEVAETPDADFHFFHGRTAAELYDYPAEALDAVPEGAVASFAGVGNPHLRAAIRPGETVLDLGSGAGLDALIAARAGAHVIGVDMNPVMLDKARGHAGDAGLTVDFRQGTLEKIPVEDASVDVILSNGVVNLSFQKRKVAREMLRVLKPGGRLSLTDIVSAKQLSESIVNDPKLWAA
ncbi:MAG TPA: methyltransferase domain-containing protein [Longimicrobiales bacterium]|nr:methyltransferase domain-containing protein [Longimicrobiales bacterium]